MATSITLAHLDAVCDLMAGKDAGCGERPELWQRVHVHAEQVLGAQHIPWRSLLRSACPRREVHPFLAAGAGLAPLITCKPSAAHAQSYQSEQLPCAARTVMRSVNP